MSKRYYAHSTEQVDKNDWQLLDEHLITVGEIAAENARFFSAGKLARVVGRLHDLGKYTEAFFKRLMGDNTKVDHATWGAVIAVEKYGKPGLILAYAIAGHHAGLANGRDSGKRTSLSERIKKELPILDPVWQTEIQLPEQLEFPAEFQSRMDRIGFQFSFFTRMLFSCLVDADYLDTEAFYLRHEKNPRAEKTFPDLKALRQKFISHLNTLDTKKPINKLRSSILNHVREMSTQSPGLFSLNVPTGGGKTLTSMAFALDHAIHHGQRRVIFVIPFTSVVEQTASVYRQAFGSLGDHAVLEHHSAFDDDPGKQREAKSKLSLAMENWDAPIIITTAVQFFESLFADRPSKCRKLHNISNSVVILDEAQFLPIKLLHPCVAAMDELTLNYKSSLVLCTATQPALQAKDGFTQGLSHVRELAPQPSLLQRQLKRVQLQHTGSKTDDELAALIGQQHQVLCIVNNRKHANCLFNKIRHLDGARHLTTLMCAVHRRQVLEEIKALLSEGKPCRLISTSLIEAGVDISFQTVFREEAGLDSIAQSAGRCNREGKYPVEDSNVMVFSSADDWSPPPEIKQFAQAARSVFRLFPEDPLSLEAIQAYFKALYWQKGEKNLDAYALLPQIEAGQIENIPFEMLASKFRMIESNMLPIIIPFDKSVNEMLEQLSIKNVKDTARKLQPYLVQIPDCVLRALKQSGAVQAVLKEQFDEQFLVLTNSNLYDQESGLNFDDPLFFKAESLMF